MPREMRLLGAASLWIDVTCRQERCRFEKEPLQKSLESVVQSNLTATKVLSRSWQAADIVRYRLSVWHQKRTRAILMSQGIAACVSGFKSTNWIPGTDVAVEQLVDVRHDADYK